MTCSSASRPHAMPDWYSRTTEARTPLLCSFDELRERVRHGRRRALRRGPEETHPRVRILHRRRPQHADADHLKQRQVETDAKRQNQRRRNSKRRRLHERADANRSGPASHRRASSIPTRRGSIRAVDACRRSAMDRASTRDARCISRTSSRSRRDRFSKCQTRRNQVIIRCLSERMGSDRNARNAGSTAASAAATTNVARAPRYRSGSATPVGAGLCERDGDRPAATVPSVMPKRRDSTGRVTTRRTARRLAPRAR